MKAFIIVFTTVLVASFACIWAVNLPSDKDEDRPYREEIIKQDAYLRGFLDGASHQEVYRFHTPNTNKTPVIVLEDLIREEAIAYHRSYDVHPTNKTNKMETITALTPKKVNK